MTESSAVDLDGAGFQVDERPLGVSDALGVQPTSSAAPTVKPAVEVAPVKVTFSEAPAAQPAAQIAPEPVTQTADPEKKEEAAIPVAEPEKSAEEKPGAEEPLVPYISQKVLETLRRIDLNINQLCIYSRANANVIFDQLKKLYPTEESRKAATEDPISFYNLLRKAAEDGWGTTTPSYRETLETKYGEQGHRPADFLTSQSDKSLGSLGDNTSRKFNAKTVDLTGAEARDAFMNSICGIRRVKLLNSGFWVVIQRPQIHELQDLYDAVDMEGREFGYSIGPHYALIADIYLKKRFVDALIKYRIIRDSNLVNIYKGDTFQQALAFHDYDVLLHAVLSLMSRSGMRLRVACPHCAKIDIVENIDIGSAKFVNRDLLTKEMTAWWDQTIDAQGNPVRRTLADLKKYREEILGFKHVAVEKFIDTKIRMTFGVPTMAEYFKIGEKLAATIRDAVNEKATEDESERRQALIANVVAHLLHMIAPWIKTLEKLDDNGEVEFRTSDAETVLQTFDIATQELRDDDSQSPLDELMKFLAASKISYIGTTALECPHCHAKPDVGFGEFFPIEVQTTFFGQLYRLLPPELTQTVDTEA